MEGKEYIEAWNLKCQKVHRIANETKISLVELNKKQERKSCDSTLNNTNFKHIRKCFLVDGKNAPNDAYLVPFIICLLSPLKRRKKKKQNERAHAQNTQSNECEGIPYQKLDLLYSKTIRCMLCICILMITTAGHHSFYR